MSENGVQPTVAPGWGRLHLALPADPRAPGRARRAVARVLSDLRPLERRDATVVVSDLVAQATASATGRSDAVTMTVTVGSGFDVEVVATREIPALPSPVVALLDAITTSWSSTRHTLAALIEWPSRRRFHHLTQDELIGRIGNGDEAARRQLALGHLGLGLSIARRFEGRGVDLDDLVAVAELGLVRAANRFDPDLGASFSTFATHVVTGELRQYFRDQAWSVGMPRSVRQRSRLVSAAREHLLHHLGRPPTDTELAHEVGLAEVEVREAMVAGRGYRADSFQPDQPRAGVGLGYQEPGLVFGADRVDLGRLLTRLDPLDREIMHLYFIDDLTQAQIAGHLEVSQAMVSRRITASLAWLRQEL